MNRIKTFAVAGMALTALSAAPAHAQFTGCGGSNSGSILFSTLISGGTQECQIGDKLYSNFVFTISTTDPNATINIGSPTMAPEQHTLVGSSTGWANGTFSYKVTALSTEKIRAINFDTQSSLIGKGYNWTADAPEIPVPGAPVTLTETASSAGPFYTADPNGVTFVNVSHGLTNTGAPLQSFTDTVIQTPGPLPILGAGAAFGFTRKLRRRINASA